ncbi:uncharacterized protein LOC124896177 [Capsicum annuum]|uniref:uncharacterized protein LOC124896177 n=1 Tax=Capsicum annuum TaxID=4072 RepID=UPI001FB0D8FD|nr:uncharacterized protein LOC124896177 [Capsicum annuum]
MKKKHEVDSNKEAPKYQDRNEKEPMILEEMVDEEKDLKVIENDELQSDPLPTYESIQEILGFSKLRNLSINIPLLEVIQEILGFAKLMRMSMSKKCRVDSKTIEITHVCSAIMTRNIVKHKEDPGGFTIPCKIGTHKFNKALCDLGASINLMLYAIYRKLRSGTPTPTIMRLLMVDWSIKRLVKVLFDVLVKVERFILLANFVVLDFKINQEIPIILG